ELAPGGVAAPQEAERASDRGRGPQLTFRLIVPRPESPQQEIVADVDGGPIGLQALGVHEGDLGLLRVAQASIVTKSHVVLAPEGRKLYIDGDGKVSNLSIKHAALSDEPVMGLELAWRAKGEAALDGSAIHLDDAELDLGAIRVLFHGTVDGTSARR